ncbi:CHAT domain-containing protein [Phenylobacterium aquaticum]|uniref:CHAT domain-containing protein n=1 Tax=Phenylobacterium aquaticum TaxID=1763816 RepID=UPI001F5C3278|nr:CHAT domain-containing protein [Phenylobacterium aquaticum]MCI3131944.1 hypothetical protein [Phenylobacterium aquaticum]
MSDAPDFPPGFELSLDYLPDLGPKILYLVAVSDWRPEEATPLAGFSLELCRSIFLLRALQWLPADVMELVPEFRSALFARRMTGAAAVQWHPQSPRAIRSFPAPLSVPFTVILLGEDQNADDYREWAQSCPTPPTLVANAGGDLTYNQLTWKGLQARLLYVCDHASEKLPRAFVTEMRGFIASWEPLPGRKLDYEVGGHGSITPNLAALLNFGFDPPGSEPFKKIGDLDAYVDQIALTTASVLAARQEAGETVAEESFPRRPALNLFAPAMYPGMGDIALKPDVTREMRRDFQLVKSILERQTGYSFEMSTQAQVKALMGRERDPDKPDEFKPDPHFLVRLRQYEVGLTVEAMAALCGSELSAAIRLPNDINRTLGAVRQFANHYRSNARSPLRTAEAFGNVQNRLAAAVPAKLRALIAESKGDIRIVSDAHLEWLDIEGLPLCVRRNLSRIPVTPGNMFIAQMTPPPIIRLTPEDFSKILIISALDPTEDRDIRGMFDIAFTVFGEQWRGKLEVEFVDIGSEEELIAALNSFEGAMLIFDGHGSHERGQPAQLHLGKNSIDIWSLHGKVRIPPIVVLSACDTHAADRNHATTANGFLSLGARTVLSSVLPLDARLAAIFAARLVYRVADFIPAAVGMYRRALTWTEIVCGLIRMQLLSEFIHAVEHKNIIDRDQAHAVLLEGTQAINGLAPDPWSNVVRALMDLGLDEALVMRELRLATANSSAISYINVGRPETIIVDTPEGAARRMKAYEDVGLG